jgi:hypothetical protein
MTFDDFYLRQLDSLASFYNSQITAHVGYEITVTVGLLAILLTFLSIGKDTPYWIPVIVFDIVCLLLYFRLPRPSFVLRHLLGTTQYYQEMSHIVFEHMGLTSGHFEDLEFETLMERALKPTLWYKKKVIFPTWLGYAQNTLLSLGHEEPSSRDRKLCLKHVFDC